MMRVLLALSLLAAPAFAAQDNLAERIDAVFAGFSEGETAGASVGVLRDGAWVHHRGYGTGNLETGSPLDPESVFYLASMSKQFTAACLALLVLRGKVALDDDVREYVPELPDIGQTITLQHLVHHTSGLRDYLSLMSMAGASFEGAFDNSDALEAMSRQRGLNFPPGDRYLYSNSNYILIATIVERVSEMSLDAFAQANLFGPLGMKRALFDQVAGREVADRVEAYAGTRAIPKNFTVVGDGGMLGCIDDLARWDASSYGNTLDEGLWKLMLQRGKLADGTELDYAFGLIHGNYRGLDIVRHGGSFVGFTTEMIRFPAQRVTVIVLSNDARSSAVALAEAVTDLVLADEFLPTPAAPASPTTPAPRADWSERSGWYRSTEGLLQIEPRDDFVFVRCPAFAGGMRALSATELEAVGAEPRFHLRLLGEPGKPSERLELSHPWKGTFTFSADTTFDPAVVDLEAYAGSYSSEELGVVWTLAVQEKELVALSDPSRPLLPRVTDGFTRRDLSWSFQRSKEGNVVGFTLHSGRAMGLAFVRD